MEVLDLRTLIPLDWEAIKASVSKTHRAIIVSEETGSISVAYRGQFYLRLNAEELESLLTKDN